MNYDTNEWVKENICSAAAIYGDDGVCWAYSPTFPELLTYDFPLEGMDGGAENVSVNEVKCACEAANGNRNPTKAGIRMGNKKYMLVFHDPDKRSAQLKCMGGGGGAVAKLNTGVVIALFDKDATMSDGKLQNCNDVETQVASMATYLRDQGY